jgi:hypothetical protein
MVDGWIGFVADAISRGWANFVARPSGPLNFRFIVQPAVAAVLAARAGVADARAGRPPYLWAAFVDPDCRRHLTRSGWKDLRTVFLMAAVLDAAYQLVVHRFVYPLELLFTASLLAVVPYCVLRGPINRVARLAMHGNRSGGAPQRGSADEVRRRRQ